MRKSGFTLVELMIAVAILAIVAAVAMPIYNQYTQRTYRSEAMADLLNCAQAMERFAAENFSYTGAVLDDICEQRAEDQGRYVIDITAVDANSFTLTATPVAGGVMGADGAITYNSAGERTWNGNPTWEE